MKNHISRRFTAMLLCAVMIFSICAPVMAGETAGEDQALAAADGASVSEDGDIAEDGSAEAGVPAEVKGTSEADGTEPGGSDEEDAEAARGAGPEKDGAEDEGSAAEMKEDPDAEKGDSAEEMNAPGAEPGGSDEEDTALVEETGPKDAAADGTEAVFDGKTGTFNIPGADVTVSAEETQIVTADANYYDPEDGEIRTMEECRVLTKDTEYLPSGWYVVQEDIDTSLRLYCTGEDVNLIVPDGISLTARNGISVNEGMGLTIWGESRNATGKLSADGSSDGSGGYNAGIGGDSGNACGTIVINGGSISAVSAMYAAGIGGGYKAGYGSITINGGDVTAVGGAGAAGIGGGYMSETAPGRITIHGGRVTATGGDRTDDNGGDKAAGIGGDVPGPQKGELFIRLTDPEHFVLASRYDNIGIIVESGCIITDGENIYEGHLALTDDNIGSCAGKKLVMYSGNSEEAAVIRGVSGSFGDTIKLNFYFGLPADAVQGGYITLHNETTGQESAIPMKDAAEVEGKGFKFSVPLVAKQVRDVITARAYDKDDKPLRIIGSSGADYTETGVQASLIRYFDWLEKGGCTEDEQKVGAAAKDYGTAAQIYFDYNAEGLAVSSAVNEVTKDMLSGYAAKLKGTMPAGVSIKGISVMLESDNTLRLYFSFKGADPESLSYKIDGKDAGLKKRPDGMRYLALDTGVYSNHLQDIHTYSVSDGTNTCTITASILTFAMACARKNDMTVSNLGKALYLYNRAAMEAFGGSDPVVSDTPEAPQADAKDEPFVELPFVPKK